MATHNKIHPVPQPTGAKELTAQERVFVEAYAGNPQDAARIAGYASPENYGYRLMRNPKIREALRARNMELDSAFNEERRDAIMGRDEILRELTNIARSQSTATSDKIKTLDLLGKAIGLWVIKHEVTTITYEDRVKEMLAYEAAAAACEFEDV